MPTAMPLTPDSELAVQTPPLSYPAKTLDSPAEVAPSELPVMSPTVAFSAAIDIPSLETASKILRIIDRYRLRKSHNAPEKADEGALKFLALIYSHVKAGEVVPMCLPAFPFKSPNSSTKVLGTLPDRAEELALAHMNGLCLAIKDVYAPGALLTIISDGLVYNVSISLPETLDEMTYVANATNFRRALLNTFSRPDWDWKVVSQSTDVCLTYRGYIKFLETDLQTVYPLSDSRSKSKFKRGLEYIAKEMMSRGDAFASAVRQKYKDHVRLSIHPSTGAAKLSISPLPTTSMYTTPWHCTVAYMLDGTVSSGMRSDFEEDSRYELIYENGQPSYYREKSELTSWAEEKGGITCTPMYPCGWMIKPAAGNNALSITDVDAKKVRGLAEINSPIVLRGFAKSTNRDLYVEKAKDFGEPTPWKFGLVLEVKDQGDDTRGLNNVLSAEWMPWHYDGLFKTAKQTDANGNEKLISTPPKFQFFVGATNSPKDTGFTLFASSGSVFKHLPEWLSVEDMSKMTWSVSTSSFDQTVLGGLPLVVDHPTTGKPCLRYHEPWPSTKTKFDATNVTIEGREGAESAKICEAIDEILHDRRVAYYHAWDKGDMVISDNILMMHTRSDFKSGSNRELWRIHFD